MNRRTAIRNVAILSAGASLLPSCLNRDGNPVFSARNIALTGSQEKMLAELSETIIPGTPGFIGAKSLRAHEFVLTMVDDCTPPEEQKQFTRGMEEFEDGCKKKWGHSFEKCTPGQRKEWLQLVESKKDASEDAAKFYETTKRYTVQSFISSEKYMTAIRHYNMVPGSNYKGCVPVK